MQSISLLHSSLTKKKISCRELIDSYFQTVKKRDGEVRAFLELFEEEALETAGRIDKKIAAGKKIGPLEGIPAALKDNLLYQGHIASAGSKILEKFIAPYTATAVRKLLEAGVIFLGRTNMDEFAMGSSTENSAFGPTRNPRDLNRVPGGSSGGSAAAVAAGMCAFALGSDTGGSIRQPASFCGAVGLKPTYGAVSRYGLIAMASSLDVIGPLARAVEDAETVFNAMRGADEKDATTKKIENKNPKSKISDFIIGLPEEYLGAGLDPAIAEKIRAAAENLRKQGAKIKKIRLPDPQSALAAYYLIMPSEVSSNMARFDGMRYGLSLAKNEGNLLEVYSQTRTKGLGAEVKRRIILGTFALSSGYYDAFYKKAKAAQARLRREFIKILNEVDCLITPTAPTTAFKIGEKISDPLTMYLSDIFTVSANLAGLPALSVPAGSVNGLPAGLQIIGRPFEEKSLFALGKIIEQNQK